MDLGIELKIHSVVNRLKKQTNKKTFKDRENLQRGQGNRTGKSVGECYSCWSNVFAVKKYS